jgi:hypothetical protein
LKTMFKSCSNLLITYWYCIENGWSAMCCHGKFIWQDRA